MLRYDGSGCVHRWPPDVLVSSSLSPWRHERGVRKAGVEGQWELARVEGGVKKARTGVLRRGCVVVGVVFVLVSPPWV